MASTTKQQLQQQVEQLRAECDRLRIENAALRSRSCSDAPTKPKGAVTVFINGVARVTYLSVREGIEAMQRIKTVLPNAKIYAR